MKIIKRNGSEVAFDKTRIEKALLKAGKEADNEITSEIAKEIADFIEQEALKEGHSLSVEDIQDLVETELMKHGLYRTAKLFISYRYKRTLLRKGNTTDARILSLIEENNEDVKQENSNKNPTVVSVQRDYMAGEVSKDITRRFLLPPDIVKAHDEGIIHFHDADYFSQHSHNCFSERTRFITKKGVKPFSDFKDGDKVEVLDKNGEWREATVHLYGKQQMWNVTLERTGQEKDIVCTADHRWVLQDGQVTSCLRTGDVLYKSPRDVTGGSWKVRSMTPVEGENAIQDAWCVVEPETHTFTLEDGVPTGNCDLVNLDDMLQNGTVISGTRIDRPHSFSTACNIATQIIAQVASCQYGGQSITLSHLAPFVQVSREKIKRELETSLKETGIQATDYQLHEMIEKRVRDEIKKGVQTIQYQVITLMTTNGQAPFITVFMYLNEVPEGQTRDDLALIIEEVLKQRKQGVKNESGAWITPAFPKLIYVLQPDNIVEGSRYFYLTRLAAECTAKRMVPDYISEKKMLELKIDKNGNGNCYPCMGCVDGKEVVSYKLHGLLYSESIERMWERLSDYYELKTQPNGIDLFLDTPGVEIYDQKKGFVKNYRIIKNKSNEWVNIQFSSGRSLTCTVDHPFETENRGVVLAKDLLDTDLIAIDRKSVEPEKRTNESVKTKEFISPTSIKMIDREAFSYDVTTESEHFTVSGIYSHNCRSFLTPYVTENGEPKYYGRFNQGVVTLNLVDVALSSGKDFDKFWQLMSERLELCHRALRTRHERLLGTSSDVAPILWQNGALARLPKGEKIDKLLFGGYSTISLGYAGLYECVYYMTGKSHTDEEAKPFALSVMKALNDACKRWKTAENIDYSVYGTPLESTTYKFAKRLKKRFGVIPGVTDRNYITNSYHVHVSEKIDAFTKLSFESEFQELSPGGAISYVEVPNMENNIEAVLALLKHIYQNIMYAELNTKSDFCQVCSYSGEIQIVEDSDGKLVWECPRCGNRDQTKMNVARRTCGYIGTQYWNQGRTQEIRERVLHL